MYCPPPPQLLPRLYLDRLVPPTYTPSFQRLYAYVVGMNISYTHPVLIADRYTARYNNINMTQYYDHDLSSAIELYAQRAETLYAYTWSRT